MVALLVLAAGFASGIFLRSLFVFGLAIPSFAVLIAFLFLVAAYILPRRIYLFTALFFLMTAFGMLRYGIADTPLPKSFEGEIGSKVMLKGVIVADPDVRDANQRVTVSVTEGNETTNVLAVASRYPVVATGETVSVSGTLALPQAFATDGGRVFRYDKYLEKDGTRFLINYASLSIVKPAPWWSLPANFSRAKHAFLSALNAVLPEPYASLAGGLVIGGKQGLGTELLNAFVLSGLVQIVVLSGYNVMVVAEAVMSGLGLLKLSRKLAGAAGAVAIIIFILIAGASSSSLRAGLMALIALYARATGRTYVAGRALLLIIFLMLMWNPFLLAFDPGFELSVAATAGIIWLSPLIELRLSKIRNAFWRAGFATTVAAQLSVLPLLLYETGTLSLVSIPANLIVLPVMPLAMAASAMAGLSAMLFGSFALPLALPAYLLNAYIILVARIASSLPLAAFQIPAFPFLIVVFMYAVVIVIAVRKYHVHKKSPAPRGAGDFKNDSTTRLSEDASLRRSN